MTEAEKFQAYTKAYKDANVPAVRIIMLKMNYSWEKFVDCAKNELKNIRRSSSTKKNEPQNLRNDEPIFILAIFVSPCGSDLIIIFFQRTKRSSSSWLASVFWTSLNTENTFATFETLRMDLLFRMTSSDFCFCSEIYSRNDYKSFKTLLFYQKFVGESLQSPSC